MHVSRFIQSTSYSWRSDIWSKEKLHKENGQKTCCYCGFESIDELGTSRRYNVFLINALANGLIVIIFTQNQAVLKKCPLAVSLMLSWFMYRTTILVMLSWNTPCCTHIPTKRCAPSLPVLNFLLLTSQLTKTTVRGQKIPLFPIECDKSCRYILDH